MIKRLLGGNMVIVIIAATHLRLENPTSTRLRVTCRASREASRLSLHWAMLLGRAGLLDGRRATTQKFRGRKGSFVPDSNFFEVSGREPIPTEDPDRDDWKQASRD